MTTKRQLWRSKDGYGIADRGCDIIKLTYEEIKRWIASIWWNRQEDIEISTDSSGSIIYLFGNHYIKLPNGEFHYINDIKVNKDVVELIYYLKWGAISTWLYFDKIEDIRYIPKE